MYCVEVPGVEPGSGVPRALHLHAQLLCVIRSSSCGATRAAEAIVQLLPRNEWNDTLVARAIRIRCCDCLRDGAQAGSRERSFAQLFPAMVPKLLGSHCIAERVGILPFAGCIYEQHQQARHAATSLVVPRRNHVTPFAGNTTN